MLQLLNSGKEVVISNEQPGHTFHGDIEYIASRFAEHTGHEPSILYDKEWNTIKIFSEAYNIKEAKIVLRGMPSS